MADKNTSTYSLKWIDRINAVAGPDWDRLASSLTTPLLEWEWLHQLEASGSLRPEVGWMPFHLTVWRENTLAAAAPLYIKGHSAGEFVFDHAWADVAQRLGIRYYPKLVGMSPFSPIIGYRFLVAPEEDERHLTKMMLDAIDRFCQQNRLSGCSFLFVDPNWQAYLTDGGFTGWRHQSYVWQNPGFDTFEDYLAIFNANQRRNIRKERQSMQKFGITLETLTGDAIPQSYFSIMYRYYERTNDLYGPWGCKYLNPEFFNALYDRYRHRLLIVAAYESAGGRLPIGMSFLLFKGDRLYGRYWGCEHDVRHLHFNACYYTPIEWAIANNIRYFDPGMGSAHKVRRGFESISNFSQHRFYDERLQQLLRHHIDEINRQEKHHIDQLNRSLPFSKTLRKPRLRQTSARKNPIAL